MKAEARLFANLGAEEGARWRVSARDPRVAKAGNLWASLFPRGAERSDSTAPMVWPESLGPARNLPAFPWLKTESGLVPWLSTQEAWDHAASQAIPLHAAAPEIVAHVHDKAFSQEVARSEELFPSELANCISILPPEDFRDLPTALGRFREITAAWPDWARTQFTVKPRFGSSGRRRLAGRGGEVDKSVLKGALGYLRESGGAILEPWLDRTRDLSAQLYIHAHGPPLLLGTLEQTVTPSGLYRGHRGWVDARGRVFSGLEADEQVREAAVLISNAAQQQGYTGPAGLDAFLFRRPGPTNSETPDVLRPVAEFNARFTMGIVVLGLVRAAIERIRERERLHPEHRLAFSFSLEEPAGGWDLSAYESTPGTHWFPLWRAGDKTHSGLIISTQPLDSAAN
jgi:hypothetical protein